MGLESIGLPPAVVRTIQYARAQSTTASYAAKWSAFQRWCMEKGTAPTTCPVVEVLTFLQTLVERNLALSTVKAYAAAISSCHEGFGERTVCTPTGKTFSQGCGQTETCNSHNGATVESASDFTRAQQASF